MRRTTVVGTLVFALIVGCLSITCMSTRSSAQVGLSVTFGPPAIPVYDQPICPGDGYLWTPGYWAWDPDAGDYYWVPGTWILAPQVGYLWTPPWWGWEGGRFWFHEGWWGPSVGFYGGINYGFGYFGNGFVGGRWQGDHFFYNHAVTNVNIVNIRNVYNERVTINENRVSFNGGPGGVVARASGEEEAAARGRRMAAVSAQTAHVEQARGNRELRASVNQGRPAIAATGRAGEFSHPVAARQAGGAYHPPAERGGSASREENRAGTSNHPNELPRIERPTPPNTGNARLDTKYKQQQENLYNKQNQERQKLQAQQEKEHQQAQQRNYNNAQRQQMEQRHQQQTQQMQQRHQQQTQQLQARQAPRGGGKR